MRKYISLFVLFLSLSACEDVIEVDLNTEPPRLNVDALIRLDTSADFTTAQIKVGLTSSFFEENEAAQVSEMVIQNQDYVPTSALDSNFIIFTEIAPGIYEGSKSTSFFTSGSLTLSINYQDELYLATTAFVPTVPFDEIVQGNGTLFSGDETEVIVSFTDSPDRDDFYLFDFGFNEFLVSEDEFYQGERFEFSYFYDDEVRTGAILEIGILGADQSFFNYMNQLIVQSGGNQGPFQTPVGTVRGNIINVTGIDNETVTDNVSRANNFALGYFAVVQEFRRSIAID